MRPDCRSVRALFARYTIRARSIDLLPMKTLTQSQLREMLLEVVAEHRPQRPEDGSLQMNTVFVALRSRLGRPSVELQQRVLSEWHDLMCLGYFAWGVDWDNPDPPFFHVTDRGAHGLKDLARNPANPEGYLRYIASVATLNPVATTYLREGLACFTARLHKSAAVMLGAASESVILELRDAVTVKLQALGVPVPSKLMSWQMKVMLDALGAFFESKKSSFARELREEFEAYFQALPQPIRAARNDAGHPSSVDPVSDEAVHASYLLFPELVRLASALKTWVGRDMT